MTEKKTDDDLREEFSRAIDIVHRSFSNGLAHIADEKYLTPAI